jgi:hypothetical protein
MSNQPTPEVDALAVVCYDEGGIDGSLGFCALPLNDARKLERQRDEARELARDLRDALELKMVDHRPYGSAQLARARKATQLIEKAKEVLP